MLLPLATYSMPDNKTPQKPGKITRTTKPSSSGGKTNSGSKTNGRKTNTGKSNSGKSNTSDKTSSGQTNTDKANSGKSSTGAKPQSQKEQEEQKRQNEELERLRRENEALRRQQEEQQKAEAERKRKQAEEERRQREQALQTLSNRTFTANGVSFKMIGVEGGTFQMGSNDGDSDEKPVHSVTLSSYYIGQTEVTQALWKAVMGKNPSSFKGDNLPVEEVKWDDCQKFITKLNQLTGKTFRLPTEAEWEFAARGGKKSQGYKYSGSNTVGDVAWYKDNSGRKTHEVATKDPNELGIYDMSGNVGEWCQDRYGDYSSSAQTNPTGLSSGSRVYRGGSWLLNVWNCRSAYRRCSTPGSRYYDLGLRLVLSE